MEPSARSSILFKKEKTKPKSSEISHPETFSGDGRSLQEWVDDPERGRFNKPELTVLKIIRETKSGKIKWEPESDDNELWRAHYKKLQLFVSVRPDPTYKKELFGDWVFYSKKFELTIFDDGDNKAIINKYSICGYIIDELLSELRKNPCKKKIEDEIFDKVLEDLL